MGNRGNIVIRYGTSAKGEPKDIYFYTHWNGSEIEDIVRRALRTRRRWDDDAYLAPDHEPAKETAHAASA